MATSKLCPHWTCGFRRRNLCAEPLFRFKPSPLALEVFFPAQISQWDPPLPEKPSGIQATSAARVFYASGQASSTGLPWAPGTKNYAKWGPAWVGQYMAGPTTRPLLGLKGQERSGSKSLAPLSNTGARHKSWPWSLQQGPQISGPRKSLRHPPGLDERPRIRLPLR